MGSNLTGAIIFLVGTLLSLYTMVIMLRFVMQLRRVDFYNPLSQFTVKVTSPLLSPLRRIIPGFRGIDIASLVLAYVFCLLTIAIILLIAGAGIAPAMLFWFGLLKLLLVTLQLYFLTLILQVILSWVSSGGVHPLMGPLWSINEPLLRPFRKLIPPLGGFDLSPLFAFILLQFLSYLVPLPGILR